MPVNTYSFEFFPPRTPEAGDLLRRTWRELATLKPDFFSVTYGAGGSTRDKTLETALEIRRETGIEGVPHISCIGSGVGDLKAVLETYRTNRVRHTVALRGDLPSGSLGRGELQHASELVQLIRRETGDWFHVEVACYPEFHPQAQSASADLANFKRKVDAGADSALTQYFYNPDAYFRFLDSSARLGIHIPIVPGVMPITNSTQLVRFSDACGAEIPRWILKRLQEFGDDRESIRAFGVDVTTSLCERLLAGGAPGLHIYTMNRYEAARKIWNSLKLPRR
ncbi:MAG: methylenetetrahydrofolate reductase [NAD(P)H] [Gammaproteobacteria bacterium]|nr:methylenetetrahydrofolate reductase [NAD(P)H] [Gammaproteobacteria bacterium]